MFHAEFMNGSVRRRMETGSDSVYRSSTCETQVCKAPRAGIAVVSICCNNPKNAIGLNAIHAMLNFATKSFLVCRSLSQRLVLARASINSNSITHLISIVSFKLSALPLAA